MIDELVLIISAIVTYSLGKISKKMGWNENFPIPIQNLIIGTLVFIVYYLYQRAIGTEIIVTDLVTQIYYSLGGSGLATLAYDTTKINKK